MPSRTLDPHPDQDSDEFRQQAHWPENRNISKASRLINSVLAQQRRLGIYRRQVGMLVYRHIRRIINAFQPEIPVKIFGQAQNLASDSGVAPIIICVDCLRGQIREYGGFFFYPH